jgi:non-ribosomal peptide synthetase component E (peptide arylation enzyme)
MSVRDLVPSQLRSEWQERGWYSGQDGFRLFEEQARKHPDAVAVIDDAGEVSYGELEAKARFVAGRLAGAGVGPGDIVGIQVPNAHQACAIDLAVAALGAVCLPYPMLLRERETLALLGRSRAGVAVVAREFGGHDYAKMIDSLRTDLPALHDVFVLGDAYEGFHHLDPALGAGTTPPPLPDGAAVDPDGPGRILVTSGTESLPKMVVFSHHAVSGGIGTVLAKLDTGAPMRVLCLVPLSSGFGALGTFGAVARLGQTLVVTAAFDPARALDLVERHRVTHILGVPTMLVMMLGALEKQDVSSLEVVGTFGSALARATLDEARARFGCAFVNGYGCSDGAASQTALDDSAEHVAQTVGRPDPAVSAIRICDEDGNDVAAGEVGEVWGRGPLSPMCYLEAPDLDARYRTDDGWSKTGDLGTIGDDGYLRIVGRVKDIIIRGGYNISPGETEELLVSHPSVFHAACVGMPDDRLGERMCAFVVLRPGAGAPSLEEIAAHLTAGGLAKNKLPERLEVIDDLPLGPTGKILKRVLREIIAAKLADEGGSS